MNLLDRVKVLCKSKGISLGRMEKEIGISNGASSKWKVSSPSFEILQKLSSYFDVSLDFLMTGKETEKNDRYYLNDETAKVAQEIFENRELRALFNVQRNMDPDDLRALHNMALALKRKEKGYIDDTGC